MSQAVVHVASPVASHTCTFRTSINNHEKRNVRREKLLRLSPHGSLCKFFYLPFTIQQQKIKVSDLPLAELITTHLML